MVFTPDKVERCVSGLKCELLWFACVVLSTYGGGRRLRVLFFSLEISEIHSIDSIHLQIN